MMSVSELQAAAAALYAGGWRATDFAQLLLEYDLTVEECKAICVYLLDYSE